MFWGIFSIEPLQIRFHRGHYPPKRSNLDHTRPITNIVSTPGPDDRTQPPRDIISSSPASPAVVSSSRRCRDNHHFLRRGASTRPLMKTGVSFALVHRAAKTFSLHYTQQSHNDPVQDKTGHGAWRLLWCLWILEWGEADGVTSFQQRTYVCEILLTWSTMLLQ